MNVSSIVVKNPWEDTLTSSELPAKDVQAVREVAARVAEIAALPLQQETVKLWQAMNDLRPERPMCQIDEIPWNEMNVDDELTLQSADPFCRLLEENLRRTLYAWNHMRCDMVVSPYVDFRKVINHDGYGIWITEDTIEQGEGNTIVSHHYTDQLATQEDIARIHTPDVSLNVAGTAEIEAKAHQCLDGILDVRMQGLLEHFALWDDIEMWRGAETVLYDFVDRPEFLHAMCERLTEVRLEELDSLEAQGLLGYGLDLIHCTGAWTTELPKPGFDPAKPRAIDNWVAGRAQIFHSVSDAMFEEFVLPYQSRYYARWGLALFGCCDALHGRVKYIRRMPNVRKISMSPWANVREGAEEIGPDYVFSRKPNPAMVAWDVWSPEVAIKDIQATLDATNANGCPVEITLKDITTCRYEPKRLWEWSEIAARMVRA
jgi:hypothetical protein